MTELYAEIRSRNKEEWGRKRFRMAEHEGREAHVGFADLIAELIQNAEDAGARCLGIRSLDKGLLVWNDGRPFNDQDVRAISGLLVSGKKAYDIGHFGIGFKVVLTVTRTPVVLSGAHRFWQKDGLDPYPLEVPSDEGDPPPVIPPLPNEVQSFVRSGAVFWLPWRDNETSNRVLREIERQQEQFEEFLLFLDRLRLLELNEMRFEASRQQRTIYTHEVLLKQPNGSEVKYLRLSWTTRPPQDVVEKILAGLHPDDERRQRWKNTSLKSLFGIALRLDKRGKPEETKGRVFVYLPTSEISGFRFHLQARMSLTVDRKRIMPSDPMTQWALQVLEEKARMLPELLREHGLFPAVWRVFPKEGEVEALWKSIAEALRDSLREGDFFYGDDGQYYQRGKVFLAHRRELYDVISTEELAEVAGERSVCWGHPELREGRAREVVRSLGVKEIEGDQILTWLEEKMDPKWWEARDKKWLHALYRYLKVVRDGQNRLKHIPLVRLQDGTHVLPENAVLPPEDPNEVPEALRPEINYIPLVDNELASKFRELLYGWGVRDFHIEVLLERMLARFYEKPPYPPEKENQRHIQLLFDLQGRISKDRLREWGQKWPLLQDETLCQVKPCAAYLPPELGGFREMRTYLRMAGGRPIVRPDYRRESDSETEWQKFLEAMGCLRLPRADLKREKLDETDIRRRWCEDREIEYPNESSTRGWVGLDCEIDGMEEIFARMAERPLSVKEARAIWMVGSQLANSSQAATGAGGASHNIWLADSAITWFYFNGWKRKGIASWVLRLRNTAWLPDEQGIPRRPGELFDPALKEILPSEGCFFLNPKIPMEHHRKWAGLLGVHTEASIDDVCRALRDRLARGAGPEAVRPIYAWLERRCKGGEEREKLREHFEKEALILVPDKGLYRRGEVSWEDPAGILPELHPHWEDLRRLFLEILEIPKRPDADTVAQYLLESLRQEKDPQEWKRVAREVERQWNAISEALRRDLRGTKWPGKQGEDRVWQYPGKLCIPDRHEQIRLLEGKVIWWELRDLERLAEKLGVRRVSEAELHLHPGNDGGEDRRFSEQLRLVWSAVRWFVEASGKDRRIHDAPPVVKKTGWLQATYRWDGIESEPVEKTAGLDVEAWVLWTVERPHVWDISDALEEGLGIRNLREFIKDIWEIDNEEMWERMLKRWQTKLGAGDVPEFPGVVEKALISNRPEVPKDREDRKWTSVRSGTRLPAAPPSRAMRPPERPRPLEREVRREDENVPKPKREYPASPQEVESNAELAREAAELAKQWLRAEGFRDNDIEDVSGYGRGYDLVARKGDEIRYVEVKGRSRRGPVEMTENEWRVAQDKGETYWLFVYVRDENKKWAIRNPAVCLNGQQIQKTIIIYRIDDWSQFPPL